MRERRCILAAPCLAESAGDGLTARRAAAAAEVVEALAGTILPLVGAVLLGSVGATRDVCDGIVDENAAKEEDRFAIEEGSADISGSGGGGGKNAI